MFVLRVTIPCLLFLAITGCGFQPLYGPESASKMEGVEDNLSKVKITPLAMREGQILHNHLLDRLNPAGEPLDPSAHLAIALSMDKVATSLRRDGTTQRFNIVATAKITLRDQESKKIIYQDTIKRLVSFSIGDVTAQFGYASTISEKDARARSLALLADEIHMMLATYYKKWATPKDTQPTP